MASMDDSSLAALPTLTTERLRLRPVTADDLDLMISLNSDPAVMTFVRGRAATAQETADEWRQRWERQSDPARGLGYWADSVTGRASTGRPSWAGGRRRRSRGVQRCPGWAIG